MSQKLNNLAKRIKSGKYTEVPWELMKAHFPGGNDLDAKRKLDAWAKKAGVSYEIQPHTVRTGKLTVIVPVVVFSISPV